MLLYTLRRELPPQMEEELPAQGIVQPDWLGEEVEGEGREEPQKHCWEYSRPARGRYLEAQKERHLGMVMVEELVDAEGRRRGLVSA